METILVMGGCGFIGAHFLRIAAGKGYKVINLDKLSYCSTPPNPAFPFYHLNIGDEAAVNRLLVQEKVDYVVNFAAESSVDKSNSQPVKFVENNVLETARLLAACHSYGKLKRFLHVSTDEVYGHLSAPLDPSFTEESPYRPRNPYAASKAGSDFIAASFFHTHGLPVVTTHCTNNYGAGQFPEKLIPKTIHRILSRERIPIYGNGLNVRDWIYVEDHCLGVLRAMEAGKAGQVYNIAGGNELTNLQVVDCLCESLSSFVPYNPKTLIQYVPDRLGHDFRYSVDASKIARDLGFTPATSWREGIAKTVTAYIEGEKHG